MLLFVGDAEALLILQALSEYMLDLMYWSHFVSSNLVLVGRSRIEV